MSEGSWIPRFLLPKQVLRPDEIREFMSGY